MKRWLFILSVLSPLDAGQRIVSTSPGITEILFALGLGDRVAGVTSYCRFPDEARRLPRIGSFLDPHLETILELRPDLVIVQKNPVRLTERLRAVRLRVLEVNPESMQGVHEAIAAIAAAAGVPDRGRQLSERMRSELNTLGERAGRLPRTKVVFFVGRTPGTLDGLIAAAKGSYLAELLEIAGGDNIFADAPAAYPKITHEELLARNPDVIIDMGDSTHTGVISEEHRQAVIRLWSRYPVLNAMRNRRVYPVADDRFVIPGPRMAQAVRLFGKLLHPEVSW